MRRLFFTGLLTACAPGDLNAWGENTTLQSAWVHSVGQDLNGLLLSTIRLPCLLGENTDPSEALLESQSLEHVYTQEGSQLIWVPLEGSLQELEKDPSVQALYFEVIESETLAEEIAKIKKIPLHCVLKICLYVNISRCLFCESIMDMQQKLTLLKVNSVPT